MSLKAHVRSRWRLWIRIVVVVVIGKVLQALLPTWVDIPFLAGITCGVLIAEHDTAEESPA